MSMSVWVHKESNKLYELLCTAKLESDGAPVAVYKRIGRDPEIWVCPWEEFTEKFQAPPMPAMGLKIEE